MVKFIVIILFYSGFIFSEEKMYIYPADYIDNDAFREAVISITGDNKKIIYNDRNREFMVFADAQQNKKIENIFLSIKSELKMIRVIISKNTSYIENSRAKVRSSANLLVSNRDIQANFNLKYKLTGKNDSLKLNSTQSLVVLSGSEAYLELGQYSPHEEWFIAFGINNGFIKSGLSYQFTGSRIVIKPILLSDGRINLQIIPEYSLLTDRKTDKIRVTSMQTEVILQEGQEVKLIESENNKDFFNRFLQYTTHSGKILEDELWVKAYVVDSV